MMNILILAPHPDDEIFALDYLSQFPQETLSVNIVFLYCDEIRQRESRKSCEFLRFKNVNRDYLPFNLKDGRFHEQYNLIKNYFKNIVSDYSTIMSPALEGGHQDHDTVAAALLTLGGNKSIEHTKLIFFPCYTGIGNHFAFKVQGTNTYCNLFSATKYKSKARLRKIFYLALCIYRSQIKTWLALLPLVCIRYSVRSDSIIYENSHKKYNITLKRLMSSINKRPLYERHGRISLDTWLRYLSDPN